jgi:uncharacterized protein (TIGR03435 family)
MGGFDQLPIVDHTALEGKWDLDVEFQRYSVRNTGVDESQAVAIGPTLEQALNTQAGLTLRKGTSKVLTYKIDSVEPPSAN